MKKNLQIISSTHAREINPLGDRPEKIVFRDVSTNSFTEVKSNLDDWLEAEHQLKEYRIENEFEEITNPLKDVLGGIKTERGPILLLSGEIYECEVNNETLTCEVL